MPYSGKRFILAIESYQLSAARLQLKSSELKSNADSPPAINAGPGASVIWEGYGELSPEGREAICNWIPAFAGMVFRVEGGTLRLQDSYTGTEGVPA